MSNGHCVIHGSFVGTWCPVCSSAAPLFTQTTTPRAPVLCPVCHGKQRVEADFYPVGAGESAVNAEYVICRTCGGKGIV